MTAGYLSDEVAPLAVVLRGGDVESCHFGACVVIDPSGRVDLAVGSPQLRVFPRSVLKPFQSIGLLEAGLLCSDEVLAVVCGSHSGTRHQTELVAQLLASAGGSSEDLCNTPGMALGARLGIEGDYAPPSELAADCSGKHAAMVSVSRLSGWPIDAYHRPSHPVQAEVAKAVSRFCGSTTAYVGDDGCGAPAFSCSLEGLARGYWKLGRAGASAAEARVVRAMTSNPELVAGPERLATVAMQSIPGLLAKDGAEGVLGLLFPNGAAAAIKVADGSTRPWPTVVVQLSSRLGYAVGKRLAERARDVHAVNW